MKKILLSAALATGVSSGAFAQENQEPSILNLPDDCIAVLNARIGEQVYDIVQCLNDDMLGGVNGQIIDSGESRIIELGTRANNYLEGIQSALNESIGVGQGYDLRNLYSNFPGEVYIGKDTYGDGSGEEFQYIDRFGPHIVLEAGGYDCTSSFSTIDQSKTTICDGVHSANDLGHFSLDECSRLDYGLQMNLTGENINIENWQRLDEIGFECFGGTGSQKL